MNEPSDDQQQAEPESERTAKTTDVELAYAAPSRLATSEGVAELSLFGNLKRDPVRFAGVVKSPLRLREALAAIHGVVGGDYRYAPKDRTAYLAYSRMRRESANLNAWQAQQAYFTWLWRNDPLAFLILDPVVTVHPDRLFLEVFSKDEGAYAQLSIARDAFEVEGDVVCGTTNIDFSQTLLDGVLQMRSYRETRLDIRQEAVQVKTSETPDVLEKKIKTPDSWIRGFLQVQSAALLPRETITLAPIDLYNIFRHLRMHADQKGKRRGLRIELAPGEPPRLVLEPWETVIESSTGPYRGRQARVIRLWGRRRLMLLAPMLAYVDEIELHLLGSGLPSFWVLRAKQMTLTLGLTGFTSSNWGQAACFDLLLPRKTQDDAPLRKIVKRLAKVWSEDEAGLSKATKLTGAQLTEALQTGCQQGQLMIDLAGGTYRLRPLTDTPLDLEELQYRNADERQAYDLLTRKAAVNITSENRIFGTGVELTGKVAVAEDKRDYRPQMLLSEEGFVSRAECTCPQFRKQGLQAGPCTHLIALRLAHAELESKRKRSSSSRKTITMETRTYSKRGSDGEQIYQLTLDRQRVRIRWGRAGADLRLQQLHFGSVNDARDDYLSRVEKLTEEGFLDASA